MTVDMQRFEMFRQGVEMLPQMAQPTDMPAAERLAKVKTTFRAKLNANMAVELESCVHCGQCAEACHFYNATQDPKYTPIRKLDLLKRFYRREVSPLRWIHQLYTRDITIQELEEWQELVYDSCTECGRCFMVCPMGINIASMVNVNRQALANAGMIPPELRAMEQEQYNGPTLFNMGPEQAEGAIAQMSEQLGIDIPLNKDKAEVMLLTSVVEVMIFNDQLIGGIKVLNHLGLDWTIHMDGFEAANFGLLSGFEPLQKAAGDKIIGTAKKIGAKKILVPECGHAYPSLRWEQANEDHEKFGFEILTMSEFLGKEVMAGRLKLKHTNSSVPVTFHDPCKVGRHSGVFEEPRAVIHAMGMDFHEMDSSEAMNWCCGGGAGVFLLNSASKLRQGAWNIKQKQIEDTGAEEVVLSCASCRLNFMNGLHNNQKELPVRSLVELAAENLAD